MKKTERFVRRNALDYILIILSILLLFSFLGRALSVKLFPLDASTCEAEIAFVIRSVDEETLALLREHSESNFSIAGNTVLKNARLSLITKTKVVVQDKDGNLIEVENLGHYDVTFHVSNAEGMRAKDGTFLLDGGRRLAQGDTLTLICRNAQYTADFVKVRILV